MGDLSQYIAALVYGAGAEIALMSFLGTMVQLSMLPPETFSKVIRTVFVGVVVALAVSQVLVELLLTKGFNIPIYLAAFMIGWLGELCVVALINKISKGK